MTGSGELPTPFAGHGGDYDALSAIRIDQSRHFVQVVVQSKHGPVAISPYNLCAGDVVLFGSLPGFRSNLSGTPTQAYQRLLFPDRSDVWGWRHVGILDENFNIWDAMPNAHIKQTPLREVLENDGLLAVLRFQQTVAPFALARALISMSRSNYNILRIETGGRLLARLAGRLPGGANAADQSVICSVFVANVLKMATGKSVLANVLIATPADFAASEEFSTVELEWCRVVSL